MSVMLIAGITLAWFLLSAVLCLCLCALSGRVSRQLELESGRTSDRPLSRAGYAVVIPQGQPTRPPRTLPLVPAERFADASLGLVPVKARLQPCPERETRVRRVVIEWQ